MPSFDHNEREGNAILCQPLMIWGSAFGGTPPYTCSLSVDGNEVPLDDSISNPQAYGYKHYFGHLYTFLQLGLRTVRLDVTDAAGNTAFSESTVMVWDDPIAPVKVAMRVEKALLYLYKTALNDPANPKNIYWECISSTEYIYASTAASILSFEEAGHLDINDFYLDPYAELVKKGLHYVMTKFCGQLNITNHPDGAHGTPVSDNFLGGGPFNNGGSGKGSFLYPRTYANGLGLMAFSMSRQTPAAAAASIVEDGCFAGWTFLEVMKDAIDLISWYQGDFNYRGAWHYIFAENSDAFDGSTIQWPVLILKAAKDRWGLDAPLWVLENTSYAYQQSLLNAGNGGCGYNFSTDRVNIGKTGGFLIFSGLFPAGVPDSLNDRAVSYIEQNYLTCSPWNCNDINHGWAGTFYAMYSAMKGLSTHNVEYLDIPSLGLRDWYKDMVAWMTAGEIYTLPPGICNQAGYRTLYKCFGQDSTGEWHNDGCLECSSLSTAHAVLVLLRSVTFLPPVAVIDPLLCDAIMMECDTLPPPENNCIPMDSSFRMNGMMSYHMGEPVFNIVNYLWSVDPPLDFDWQTATITGPHPLFPPFTSPGLHTICLRVEDDHTPPLYDMECIDIWVCDTSVNPAPIAKAIPDSLMPCYTAKPLVPITLDGSESYIPPNCNDRLYLWDYDGDNIYDTAILNSPYLTVTYNLNGSYMVGLIVLCLHDGDTVMSCADYACLRVSSNDLYVSGFASGCVHHGTDSVTLNMTFSNHTLSESDFQDVMIRLYSGDPTTSGVFLGYYHVIPLFSPGQTVTWTVTIAYQTGFDSIFVWIDPHLAIDEWNELNNLAFIDISLNGQNDTVYILEDQIINIDVLANDGPNANSHPSQVGLAGFPAHGYAWPGGLNGNPLFYQPQLNYSGIDSLPYLLRIYNLHGNLFCDDTLWVIIHIIPVNDPPFLHLPDTGVCQNLAGSIDLSDYEVFHDPDHGLGQITFSHRFLSLTPDTALVGITVVPPLISIATNFNDNILRTFLVEFQAMDDSGAVSRDTLVLTIYPSPSVTLYDTAYCSGNSVTLNAGNDGTLFFWSNGQTGQLLPVATPGTYSVTVSNIYGCRNSDTCNVTEKPGPLLQISPMDPAICAGDHITLTVTSTPAPLQTTYFWQPGNLAQPSVQVAPPTSTWYHVTATLSGCSSKDSVLVLVHPLPLIAFNQQTFQICPEDPVIVQVMDDLNCNPATYLWNTGSTNNPLLFYPPVSGFYTVTVTCSNGCSSEDSILVQYSERPVIQPIPQLRICEGDTFSYTVEVNPAWIASQCTYTWSNGATGPVISGRPEYPSTYLLTVTYQICKDTSHLSVDLLPVPEISLPEVIWLETGESALLDAGPGMVQYLWSTGYTGRLLNVADTGKYWVRVRNLMCSNADTTVVFGDPNIFVPNTFTPNEDGTNEVFYIFCAADIDIRVWIFNRWGEQIVTLNDLYEGWDGKYKGVDAPVGVYTWVLEYSYVTPGPYFLQKAGKKSGQVLLLR